MSTVTIFVYELLNKLLYNCIFAAGGGLGARTRKKNLKSLGGGGGLCPHKKKKLKIFWKEGNIRKI